VCAHEDGRFKFVQDPGRPGQVTVWSDNRRLHRYVEYGRGYQTYALNDPEAGHIYGPPREASPALHSRLFRWATRTGAGLDLSRSLQDYRINDGLSDARSAVYERFDTDHKGSARIHVNVQDRAIVRYETFYGGALRGFVEVSARELDRPLSEEDLSANVPVTARLSLQNNPAGFIAGLFLGDAALGLAFWWWRLSRAGGAEGVARLRRWLWRLWIWAFVAVTLVLGALAALTWGGSGHPPAIVYVLVMGVWAAGAFGLFACFLLASHVAQACSRGRS
jgi:hypothetical protein